MQKLLVLLSVCLLGTGSAGMEKGQDPEKILAQAIALTRICPNTTRKVDIEHGQEKKSDHGRDQSETTNKVTLAILFKPGRFDLSYVERATLPDGTISPAIRFLSKPEKEHLKAKSGEDKRFNWGMNRMNGWVYIDKPTGGIIRIEGKTPGNQPFRKLIRLAELHALEFSLKQRFIGNRWMPESSIITLHVWKIFGGTQHSRYDTEYHCTTSSAARKRGTFFFNLTQLLLHPLIQTLEKGSNKSKNNTE